jgi:mono/diheme cytochrome c family protein
MKVLAVISPAACTKNLIRITTMSGFRFSVHTAISRQVMNPGAIGIVLLTLSQIATAMPCFAESADMGKTEYVNSCAVCHGDTGKGDGPIAAYLKIPPTDLTKIQKNNMDVFPLGRVYEIIDGQTAIASHGSRDMPVWGDKFKKYSTEQAELGLRFGIPIDPEAFARDRILAVVRYISSLQKK